MNRLAILLLAAVPLFAQLNVDAVAGGKLRTGVPAQDIALSRITGLAWDPSGNLVFCDRAASLIRRIRPDGVLETLAGTGTTGFSGDGGPALNATLNTPGYPRFDPQGNLYFADAYNYRIRRIDTNGIITSVVGDHPLPRGHRQRLQLCGRSHRPRRTRLHLRLRLRHGVSCGALLGSGGWLWGAARGEG
jgi:hypothetical protein